MRPQRRSSNANTQAAHLEQDFHHFLEDGEQSGVVARDASLQHGQHALNGRQAAVLFAQALNRVGVHLRLTSQKFCDISAVTPENPM